MIITNEREYFHKKSEDLLRSWKDKSAGYRWLHNHARLHFEKIHDWLSYPSIIIGAITGVGGFAFLNPTGGEVPDQARNFQIAFATLNVIGGILTSVSKFSQSSTLIERHSTASNAYSKLYRSIDMELSLEPEHREKKSYHELVRIFREQYDKLLDDSPDVPCVSILAFQDKFKNDTRAKPEVTNGLSPVIKDESSTILTVLNKWKGALSRSSSEEFEGTPSPVSTV
jgi:hypothetical protein